MPLVRVDALEGRSKEEIKSLLDAVHRAVLSAFDVPQRDRYQIYQGYPESNLIVEDTGLFLTGAQTGTTVLLAGASGNHGHDNCRPWEERARSA